MAGFLRACGVPVGKEIDLEDKKFVAKLIGRHVLGDVEHDEYEGKKNPKIRKYYKDSEDFVPAEPSLPAQRGGKEAPAEDKTETPAEGGGDEWGSGW